MIRIRFATTDLADAWLRMRTALWPDHAGTWHAREIEQFFAGTLRMPLQVLLALDDTGGAVGFVELSIRPYAEGCSTDRVAYLEGWYVEPECRRRGVGRALVHAAEEWARSQGCTEFGSDAEIDNDVSAAAHRALGFDETDRIRCFLKRLPPSIATADRAFLEAFETCTLDEFHHRDHVRVAWIYLRAYPLLTAIEKFATGLRRFAASRGKSEIYHETITWAYLLLIHERIARAGDGGLRPRGAWNDFVSANPDLLAWPPSILERYYRKETLASDLARRVFVLPDLT